MLKDPECAMRYEESLRACEQAIAPAPPREQIQQLQSFLAGFEQLDTETTHYFAPGMYGRQYAVRADAFVVGKIHKHSHIVMLMSGRCRINTDKGMEDITGPHVWISPVGAKRALYTYTDCTFFTCHATEETDLDKLEDELIEAEPNPFLAHTPAVLP